MKLDIQALSAKIAERDLRSPQIWAHEIDREILQTLRTAANRVLIKDNTIYELRILVAFGLLVVPFFALIEQAPLDEAMIRSLGAYFAGSTLSNLTNKVLGDRLSFFTGPQIDRWGILQARTRLQHVVRATD